MEKTWWGGGRRISSPAGGSMLAFQFCAVQFFGEFMSTMPLGCSVAGTQPMPMLPSRESPKKGHPRPQLLTFIKSILSVWRVEAFSSGRPFQTMKRGIGAGQTGGVEIQQHGGPPTPIFCLLLLSQAVAKTQKKKP